MQFMQAPPPLLLPLLRSAVQGELLARLYLNPDDEYSVRELADLLDTSTATVSREADRLVEAGLVRHRRRGNLRLLRSTTDTVVTRPLTDLLAVTYGPSVVLDRVLSTVPGVAEAYLYGSWAARYHGEPGPVPADVDVLVIGDADVDDLDDAARSAESVLRREVGIRQVSVESWSAADEDPFLATVRTRPMFRLPLEGDRADAMGTRPRDD